MITNKKLNLLSVFFALVMGFTPSQATLTEPTELVVTPEHRQATGLIVHLMSNYHYLKSSLSDELSKEILERFLDNLDPNRMIFLETDVRGFQIYSTRFDDYLRVGYIKPAFDVFEVFRTRVRQRIAAAQSIVEKGVNFEIDESYHFRREDAAWSADESGLNELWRKRVKNDWLTLRLAGRTEEEIRKTLSERYAGIERRAHQLNSNDVYQLFINAYVSAVEPHTSYFSPRTSENFKIRMSLSLEGIGAALQTDDEYTVVRRLIPGGPAALSERLAIDDRIIGVGQGEAGEIVDVVSWRLEDVVDLIRGPKDSVVRLEVLKNDGAAGTHTEQITLVRNTIKLEEQAAKSSIIELEAAGADKKIGVIDVPTFYLDMAGLQAGKSDYRSTTRDVRALIEDLKTEGIDGLIIDLRGNGGGSLSEATELTGLFIPSGPVVQVRDSSGKIDVNNDPNPDLAYDGPLAVLVDRQSASASEIFAGAIQDYKRGIVVGEPTYGKGTVQNVVDLNRFVAPDVGKLGQLKVTIAQFFRVNGSSTQHKGVVPDIVFPTAVDIDEHGERAIENALPWAMVSATLYEPNVGTVGFETAKSRHEARIKNDAGFNYLMEESKIRQSLSDVATVTLLESQRKQEIEQREKDSQQRLNLFRASKGLAPLTDDSPDDAETADREEDEGFDVLLDETALILSDVITFDGATWRAEVGETSELLSLDRD